MGDFKTRAPPPLAVPSYEDAIDQSSSEGGGEHKRTKSVGTGRLQSFPILAPESLLTPRDPAFLDGASSLARFGLDIGGTLCKVVYFEPEVDLLKDRSRTFPQKSKGGGFRNGDRVANGKKGNGVPKTGEVGDGCDVINGNSLQPGDGPSAEKSKIGGLKGDPVANGKKGKGVPKTGEVSDGCDVKNGDNMQSGDADSSKKSNGCVGNGTKIEASTVRMTDGNAKELMTAGLDQLTIKNTKTSITGVIPGSPRVRNSANNVHVDSGHSVENGEYQNGNGNVVDFVSEGCQIGVDEPAVQASDQSKDYRNNGDGVGSEDDQDYHKRVKKMWVSSHEPVHLPGRGTLYFKCFETWRMQEFLSLTKEYHFMTGGRDIGATGGGARKFGDQFLEIAGLQLQRADELKSLVRGIDFLARHAQHESFEYPTGSYRGGAIQRPWQSPGNSSDDHSDILSEEDFSLIPCQEEESEMSSPGTAEAATVGVAPPERHQIQEISNSPTLKGPVLAKLDTGSWMGNNDPLHPYLVVNIGSGVSMLRVDSPDKFERVGGTSLGGSTFLGLANALTGCQSFEEAISLATQGDSTHVDMLVGDIFGGDYTEMGLAATTVASSFGKLVLPQRSSESQDPRHLAKAALLMVTNNIGSIAWLHARNAGVRYIMFTGSFLHNNELAMRLLAVAMEFWSKGNMKAVFLRHEGHAGAMGALLSTLEPSNPLDALLLTCQGGCSYDVTGVCERHLCCADCNATC